MDTADLTESLTGYALQRAELLGEMLLSDEDREARVDPFVRRIVDSLREVEERIISVSGQENCGPNFFASVGAAKVTEVAVFRPNSVEVVGSYLLRTAIIFDEDFGVSVDVAVEMPAKMFLEKDYLDHRYHCKRAAYLQALVEHLHGLDEVDADATLIEPFLGDMRKPIAIVYPSQRSTPCSVRILPALGKDVFAAAKLDLRRCNLRTVASGHPDNGQTVEGSGGIVPTPTYTQSILEDTYFRDHLKLLHEALTAQPALAEAAALIKIWAMNRRLAYTPTTPNGFVFTMLLVHLVRSGKLSVHADGYQLFRSAMEVFASDTFLGSSVVMSGSLGSSSRPTILSKLKVSVAPFFETVFANSEGTLNFLARTSRESIVQLRKHSKMSLDLLRSSDKNEVGNIAEMVTADNDAFVLLFLKKSSLALQYDACIHVDLRGCLSGSEEGHPLQLHDEHPVVQLGKTACNVLKEGLTDRIRLLQLHVPPLCRRSCIRTRQGMSKKRKTLSPYDSSIVLPRLDLHSSFLIGVELDAENALRIMDVGPSASEKELSQKFRTLWGERSQLRRFRDGRVTEVVMWDGDANVASPARHRIVAEASDHLLRRHLPAGARVCTTCDQLDFALYRGGGTTSGDQGSVENTSQLFRAFQRLSSSMKLLKKLPLQIHAVLAMNTALLGLSPFPALPHVCAGPGAPAMPKTGNVDPYVDVFEVAVQVEGSGSWPREAQALRATKAAFFINVGEKLATTYGIPSEPTMDYLDVFYMGFAFRLLLDMQSRLPRAPPAKSVQEVKHFTQYFTETQHAALMHSLKARFPTFASVCQLAKRWVGSHLCSSCIEERAVELLCAASFVGHSLYPVPSARIAGFARFIHLLATHNFDQDPLVVNLNEEMTTSDIKAVRKTFDSRRSSGTAPALFICTPYDVESLSWTRERPSRGDLNTLISLAKAADQALTTCIVGNFAESSSRAAREKENVLDEDILSRKWRMVFSTPVQQYDMLVRLHAPAMSGRGLNHPMEESSKAIDGQVCIKCGGCMIVKPLECAELGKKAPQATCRKLLCGLRPEELFVDELQGRFGRTAVVRWDAYGGRTVAIKWHPSALARRYVKEVSDIGLGLVSEIVLQGEMAILWGNKKTVLQSSSGPAPKRKTTGKKTTAASGDAQPSDGDEWGRHESVHNVARKPHSPQLGKRSKASPKMTRARAKALGVSLRGSTGAT